MSRSPRFLAGFWPGFTVARCIGTYVHRTSATSSLPPPPPDSDNRTMVLQSLGRYILTWPWRRLIRSFWDHSISALTLRSSLSGFAPKQGRSLRIASCLRAVVRLHSIQGFTTEIRRSKIPTQVLRLSEEGNIGWNNPLLPVMRMLRFPGSAGQVVRCRSDTPVFV